jgi:hypothetical protein
MSEMTSVREITVDKIKFECRCYDPHGFWRVKMNMEGKGVQQPKEIAEAQFTSLTECEKAIIAVMSKKTSKDPSALKIDVVNPLADKE